MATVQKKSFPYVEESGCISQTKPFMCQGFARTGVSSYCSLCSFYCANIICTCTTNCITSYNIKTGKVELTSNTCSYVCIFGDRTASPHCWITCVSVHAQNCCGCSVEIFNCCSLCAFCYPGNSNCLCLFQVNTDTANTVLPSSFNTVPWCLDTRISQCFWCVNQKSYGNTGPTMIEPYCTFCFQEVPACCQVFCSNFSQFYIPCCIMVCQHNAHSKTEVICYDASTGCTCFTTNTVNCVFMKGQGTCSGTYYTCVQVNVLNESGCTCQILNVCCGVAITHVCCTVDIPHQFVLNDAYYATLPNAYSCECWCVQMNICYCWTAPSQSTPGVSGIEGTNLSFKVEIPVSGIAFSFAF